MAGQRPLYVLFCICQRPEIKTGLKKIIAYLSQTGFSESLLYLLAGIMVMLPNLVPPLIIGIAVVSIIEKKFDYASIRRLFHSPLLMVLLLFVFYVAGLTYTEYMKIGWANIERKLSLLFFPLFFTLFRPKDPVAFFGTFIRFFIAGLTISAIICIDVAVANFSYEMYAREHRIILEEYPYTNYFFYSYLALFMHYGYYAMFAVMAIAFQIWLFFHHYAQSPLRKKILQVLNLVFLSVFVLMLYAKASMIMMAMVYVFAGLYVLFRLKNKVVTLVLLSVLVLSGVVLVRYVPNTVERIKDIRLALNDKNIDKTTDESTRIRLLVWACAMNRIEEKWLTGYGTGDVDSLMQKTYLKEGMTSAYKKKLNVHNQFLQTWLHLGIFGALLLLVYLLWYALYIWRRELAFLGLCYLVIVFVSFLTESTLQTQNGTIFTTLFGCLLATEHWRKEAQKS